MHTTWIDIHKVILENESEQNQQYAHGIPNAVSVGADSINTKRWIYIPLPVSRLHAIRFGYQYQRWPTDDRSKITRVKILRMVAPAQSEQVLFDETLSLNSETYTYHTVTPPPLFAHEGLMLALEISIVDFRDKFIIGPVGIEDHSTARLQVSPLDFGATGDGSTDDVSALEEAITYALANQLPIDLRNRSYAFSQTLEIHDRLEGTEKGLILRNGSLRFTGTTGSAIDVGKSRGIVPVISLENITLQGSSDVGLDLSRTFNSSFHKLSVTGGFQVGVRLLGSLFCDFRHCSFSDNAVNVQISAFEDGDDSIRSNDNKFWNCKLIRSTGTASLYIGELDESKNLIGSNNAFYACDFENSAQHAVVIDGGHGNSFFDCRFERAFTDTSQPHPWSMILLTDQGQSTRFINCWVPGMHTPEPNDVFLRVGNHKYVKIISSRIDKIDDPFSRVEIIADWP